MYLAIIFVRVHDNLERILVHCAHRVGFKYKIFMSIFFLNKFHINISFSSLLKISFISFNKNGFTALGSHFFEKQNTSLKCLKKKEMPLIFFILIYSKCDVK
jgi:hypothetical protein